MKEYIAIDLGASNGRTILGRFNGNKLFIEELSRFENSFVRIDNSYYWDILGLYANIIIGIKTYASKVNNVLSGVGIDTWGVDFGFIDKQGRIISNPRSYRDPRGMRGMKAFQQKYGQRILFDLSGIASLEFNTAYQLHDVARTNDPQLVIADKMLMMPDLLGYMLCGEATTEYTNATTTQMLDYKGNWSNKILDMVGVPKSLMTEIQVSGTEKGNMRNYIRDEAGLANNPLIFNVGSHDTASAVASVPAVTENYAFISSGTWSLIGIVSDTAVVNDFVYANRFSNEGTVDAKYRPLQNIMGLWIIQNCKRQWDREENLSWDDIMEQAVKASPFRSFIDVNAHVFFDGTDMVKKIQEFCAGTGQPVPITKGEIARTVHESLAMSYKEAFAGLEHLKGKRIDALHIVGGGSKDRFLNQLAANAVGRVVIGGPSEATAIGNLMMQVLASGEVKNFEEMRQVIRDSFDVGCFKPQDTDEWAEQFERYLKIKETRNI